MRRAHRTALAVGVLALTAMTAAPAHADVLGQVEVTVDKGTDSTLLSGFVGDARCPTGTVDSFFDVVGRDIGMGAPEGSGELGFLGPGNRTGTGQQRFTGASIANLKTTSSGSFAQSGAYRLRFVCVDPAGGTSATYERVLTYTASAAGGTGSWRIAGGTRPLPGPQPAAGAPGSGAAGPSAPGADPTETAGPGAAAGPGGSGDRGVAVGPGVAGGAADGDLAAGDADRPVGSDSGLLLGVGVGLVALIGALVASRRRRVPGPKSEGLPRG